MTTSDLDRRTAGPPPADYLDTQRIDHLADSGRVAQLEVTVVGVGSGGAQVVHPLAMCGIRRWHLFDPDRLEPVNLVKHPARRVELGGSKVDITAAWLEDRNPAAEVEAVALDVRRADTFQAALLASDLVICAVDDQASRSWVNAECVRLGTPSLTGSVIRTGLGGEVYLYLPGETGCFSCMQLVAEINGLSLDDAIDLTERSGTTATVSATRTSPPPGWRSTSPWSRRTTRTWPGAC